MINIVEWFTEPLRYAFMIRGLLATVMVGVVCAVIGTYVVLRGMAFFGDALAHSILPGVAVGYLVGEGARGSLFCLAASSVADISSNPSAVRRSTFPFSRYS